MKRLNIYEINTVTWLKSLSSKYNSNITLANVPSQEWDKIASYKFEAVWLMGVWQRSPMAIEINKKDHAFMDSLGKVLPDFEPNKDLVGSAYSISDYSVDQSLGGDEGLVTAREELNKRGLKLILDFVPNHVALDHQWAKNKPDYFIEGTKEDLVADNPQHIKVGDKIYALGRDPNYDAWSDVLQLNANSASLREAVKALFSRFVQMCDGVRCDMAMLLTNEIFNTTWQPYCGPELKTEYWDDVIGHTRDLNPKFLFIAESYWDTQKLLIHQGFDYCYAKDFYDFLEDKDFESLDKYFHQPASYQRHLLKFLENHDEPRAFATFDFNTHKMGAIMMATTPGANIYYEGQFEGYKIRTPVQLGRDPAQEVDQKTRAFYQDFIEFIEHIEFNQNTWRRLDYEILNSENPEKEHSTSVLTWGWRINKKFYIVVINSSHENISINIDNPWPELDLLESRSTIEFNTDKSIQVSAKYEQNSITMQVPPSDAIVISFEAST